MNEPPLRYDCERSLLGRELAACFAPLARDAGVTRFLAEFGSAPHGLLATKLMALLSPLGSSYDIHGLLGAYAMHLLSSEAWGKLLGQQRHGSLLDVGAGAGYVTEHARAWFDEIVCTELAAPLRRRLSRRGLTVLGADLTVSSLGRQFDVVSCFNVLDRTARPLTLLRALVSHLAPSGLLLLALPLPPSPHVHVRGGTSGPSERIPSHAASWEEAARELSERMITPAGLRIERLARVPYLSRGDAYAPLYVLDAALWVCTRQSEVPPCCAS